MGQTKDIGFEPCAFRVSQELVAVHMAVSSMEEVVTQLAETLVAHGYVKPSYIQAVLLREATCPTGLPTPGVGTAVPHAGVEHALKPGIAIATLANPVKFGELGDPASKIAVSVVFMLAVTEPEAQVYLLQSLVEVYKDADLLRRIQQSIDAKLIVDEVNAALIRVTRPRSA